MTLPARPAGPTSRETAAGAAPQAGFDAGVVDQAVAWVVHLWSGEATDESRLAWQRWREADPRHEQAWRHVEQRQRELGGATPGLSAGTAVAALAPSGRLRRRVIKGVAGLGLAGTAGAAAWRGLPWPAWQADVRTARGERRALRLADGSRLWVDTASAVDLRLDAGWRRLRLHDGGLLVQTARDERQPPRPFVVDTPAGQVRALGTRFSVRHDARTGRSRVAVFEHAVELHPRQGGPALRLEGGQAAGFDAGGRPDGPHAVAAGEGAWAEGSLVVSDWRLDAFLDELSRYRAGHLGCDPAVAALRLSGVFPLDDTDRVLLSLTEVLPVRVRRRTRWWVSVEADPGR